MIPARMDEEGISMAERRVFNLLKVDPGSKGWTVLHSLGLARRMDGPYGEIDFVVIIPGKGIICLEVKGGRVSCQTGVWKTKDRHGINFVLKKSPYLQARSGMFALRSSVVRKFGKGSAEARCPIGCAVVFTDVTCPPLTPEFERSDVIDLDDLRKPISKSITRVVIRRLMEFQPREGPHHPSLPEAKAIIQFFRPDFDLVVAKSVSISRTDGRLLRLTQEQYARLDELEANPRCLFEGAAGTGKTMLALEHARRASLSGFKVLLVCFNQLLGEWLNGQAKGLGITVGTWHSVARRFIMASSFATEFADQESKAIENCNASLLFEDMYPVYGEFALEEMGPHFDVLVMDEAQDLTDSHTFNFLNLTIRGGFASGRWAIFGDFTRQALYGSAINPAKILAQYSDHFVRAKLTLNCRNTRRIAEETTLLAGFEKPPYRLGKETGLPVEHRYWKTSSELVLVLEHVLESLVKQKTPIENIIILSPRRLENSNLARIQRISRFPLVDISRGTKTTKLHGIKFSTVHSFKGLESQVVVIVDIETVVGEHQKSILYVAMSRARSLLILMIKECAKKAVETRIRKTLKQNIRNE